MLHRYGYNHTSIKYISIRNILKLRYGYNNAYYIKYNYIYVFLISFNLFFSLSFISSYSWFLYIFFIIITYLQAFNISNVATTIQYAYAHWLLYGYVQYKYVAKFEISSSSSLLLFSRGCLMMLLYYSYDTVLLALQRLSIYDGTIFFKFFSYILLLPFSIIIVMLMQVELERMCMNM